MFGYSANLFRRHSVNICIHVSVYSERDDIKLLVDIPYELRTNVSVRAVRAVRSVGVITRCVLSSTTLVIGYISRDSCVDLIK